MQQGGIPGVPDIAIVGMGCRFPGASGVDAYWRLLEENVDAVTPVPADRFDPRPHYAPHPGEPGKTVSRHGGFIDDLYGFDAGFFGIAPREALHMDPQQRVLLKVVWESLESAGIVPSALAGSRSGVFVGQATAEYADVAGADAVKDVHGMVGSRLRAMTSGRISYALDLRGPSLTVDTACSSSLVAVHLARQSLLTGECDLAVAAGVNAVLSVSDSVIYSQGAMLSPEGRCKFGDSSADGFVRSEGVGAVLLKRLPDAVRDGDPVLAVLRGSAVTNDGRGSGLLLQPAVSGQVAMVRSACRSAGITPAQLDYVEAHGTGTRVGDEVELRALAQALREDGPEGGAAARRLRVGTVKSNIGHAEAAAGIAGLIKAVLVARHRTVPASLHHRTPHPLLADADFPVECVSRNTPLEPAGPDALIGVSSFGLSGVNAHVIVGEYAPGTVPEPPAPCAGDGPELLVLSARTEPALRRLATRYADHLSPAGPGRAVSLRALCHAAATRRDHHPFRLWAVGRTHDELADALRVLAEGQETPQGGFGEACFGPDRRIAFVFPGQGSQWLGMGRGLLAGDTAFRRTMAECDAAVREELGWSVLELLATSDQDLPGDVAVVQPLLWAVEVSLAAHLADRGITPDLCLGHSMGEAAAAYVCGALSLREAAAVICRRSTLMQRLSGQGAMLAVDLSAEEAAEVVAGHHGLVCVAAENAPRATVLAGDPDALRQITEYLDSQGVFCRPVMVNVASHSPVMDSLRDDLLAELADLAPGPATIEMFSTARCATLRGTELDAAYWMDNLRGRVRFVEAVQAVAKQDTVFVEVSPHPLLVQPLSAVLTEQGAPRTAVATLVRRQDEHELIPRALGKVFALGGRVEWSRWFQGVAPMVPLPLYAWDEEQFRREPAPVAPAVAPRGHSQEIALRDLGLDDLGAGVRVGDVSPVPPVVYFEAVRAAAHRLSGADGIALEDVELGGAPLPLDRVRDAALTVTLTASPEPGVLMCTVTAKGTAQDPWDGAVCLAGRARVQGTDEGDPVGQGEQFLDVGLTRCTEYVPSAEFYRRAAARGYTVDPALSTVARLWRRDGEAVARMAPSPGAGAAALEAGLLAMIAAWPHATGEGAARTYTPVSFERVRVVDMDGLRREHWCLAAFTQAADGDGARCDLTLRSADGRLLVEFLGIRLLRSPDRGAPRASAPGPRSAAVPVAVAVAPGPQPEPESAAPAALPAKADDVLKQMATVLGTSVSRLDPRRPLRSLGLDSLLAAELRVRLQRNVGVDMTVQRLLGPEPAGRIAQELAGGGH
ncbi:type I polyketide synthase [Streptomyces sp. NPDC005551]|uniref:type I polyketide synthase n=1 Tax=Streptomyces sp. NPDC005551 TaxID=3364725 RepID=UPI0036AE49ED